MAHKLKIVWLKRGSRSSQLKTAFQELIANLEGRANVPSQTTAPDDLPSEKTVDQFLGRLDIEKPSNRPTPSAPPLPPPAPSATQSTFAQPLDLTEMLEQLDPTTQDVTMGE